jgi:hypothetical protein
MDLAHAPHAARHGLSTSLIWQQPDKPYETLEENIRRSRQFSRSCVRVLGNALDAVVCVLSIRAGARYSRIPGRQQNSPLFGEVGGDLPLAALRHRAAVLHHGCRDCPQLDSGAPERVPRRCEDKLLGAGEEACAVGSRGAGLGSEMKPATTEHQEGNQRYAGLLCGTCLRVTGDAEHAQDATEETFHQLLTNLLRKNYIILTTSRERCGSMTAISVPPAA